MAISCRSENPEPKLRDSRGDQSKAPPAATKKPNKVVTRATKIVSEFLNQALVDCRNDWREGGGKDGCGSDRCRGTGDYCFLDVCDIICEISYDTRHSILTGNPADN